MTLWEAREPEALAQDPEHLARIRRDKAEIARLEARERTVITRYVRCILCPT